MNTTRESPVQSTSDNRGRAPQRLRWIVFGVGALLLVLLLFGLLRHYRQQKVVEAAAHEEESALPIVNVAKVRRAPASTAQLLPGNMTPLTEAYIYARANGYVSQRYVDIGDRVTKGQLLAEIEAPDLDQQVQQARAALAQAEHQVVQAKGAYESAKSQEDLAHITWDRYKVLQEHGAVAKQDADQQYTNYRSGVANVESAQANISAAEQNVTANRANLERLIVLQAYEHVRAPFTGVITARNFDIGALVGSSGGTQGASTSPSGGTQIAGGEGNAGTSGGAAPTSTGTGGSLGTTGELFRVAQINVLRILINVPQESAPFIHVGEPATVMVQELPDQTFKARVTRTSNAIDLATRTLLTEVDVENPGQKLLPGMYAMVQIENVRDNPPLLVPGDAVIGNASGVQVAVVERGNPSKIHIQNVKIGRDYGPEIEIVNGLHGGESVVVNPGDIVQEGAAVKPVEAQRAQGNMPRRGPSERQPGGPSEPIPGKADTGGHGASEKGPGQKSGGQSK